MSEERKKILEMLAEGKINVEEAEKLLSALSEDTGTFPEDSGKNPRYLRIMIEPGPESKNQDRVNVRVPLKLIRAGLKLASFIPGDAQTKVNEALHEKGIEADFSDIKPQNLDELVSQLNDLTVNIESKETVRIFCE
ncbi:MAG: hypothetical protein U9O59_08460 [Actinomycetota bacterium]|nr:hypothetical protein [Actinomycetota bacterium]